MDSIKPKTKGGHINTVTEKTKNLTEFIICTTIWYLSTRWYKGKINQRIGSSWLTQQRRKFYRNFDSFGHSHLEWMVLIYPYNYFRIGRQSPIELNYPASLSSKLTRTALSTPRCITTNQHHMRTPLHLIQYIHSTLVHLLEVITTKGAFTITLRVINFGNFARKKSSFQTLLCIKSYGKFEVNIPNMLRSGQAKRLPRCNHCND